MNAKVETHKFQAEVQQVLKLVINSLYSNKEIFLRELVSNASDACDKLRFAALSDQTLLGEDTDLAIEVECDSDARTVTIRDNGIGMTHDEVIENIGTIASSGTRRFLEQMTGEAKKDASLIGQFGVGFYSAFIVADKVTLTTRKAGTDEAWRWRSDGTGEYSIESVDAGPRGTEIVLHLKEDEAELAESYRLRSIVGRYSDHIAFPVRMPVAKPPVAAEEESDEEETKQAAPEWETVNQAAALWTRSKADISDEEYQDFYKHVSHDFNDAVSWAHNRVEGNQSYTSLLYLPSKAPFDMQWNRDDRKGLKLYVKRVFIMDAAEELLPGYLRFMRGVIDSDDLPLNVSREILQDNPLTRKIRAALIKRSIDLMAKLAKDDHDKYLDFYEQFGEVLKEGPAEDFSNRDKVASLLRFRSTHQAEGKDADAVCHSLADYVARMKSAQDKIYYLTADSYRAAINSPHLEIFRNKGIEVLLLTDRIDEWLVGHLPEFDGKPLQSVAQGDLDLGALEDEEEKLNREKQAEESKPLLERVEKTLSERVAKVRIGAGLTESPSRVIAENDQMALHMQRMLKQAGQDIPEQKPTLELNPKHPLVEKAAAIEDETLFADYCELFLDQALIADGATLDDPASYIRRVNSLLLG